MEVADIGKTFRRLDYETKVTGAAQYLADMSVAGMCHGKILRSPYPHARITRIDASKALKVPGVVAALTRDDILHDQGIEPYYGPVFKDQTIVATEKVRHVGDSVAAVAALTLDAAEEALKLIEVDYQELPAVLNVQDAIKQNPTLVHETVRIPESGFADLAELKPVDGTNICTHFRLNRGDIDKGFVEADHVFEDTFTLPATQHSFLETHACIASVEPGGRITVWATTQNPFVVRTQLANIFKVPVSKVRVIVPYLGGGYGGKVYPKVEPITVALAKKARRPVRIVLSREEVFYTITKHAAVIRMKTGVKKDGTLVARECEIHLDTGAYAEIGPRVAKKSGYTAAGPYRIANLKIDSYSVYTNKPPAGAFRGFGVSQSAWAVESQMDIIAAALKMDPLELRKKNGYDEGDKFVTEETLRSIGFKQCLDEVARSIAWNDKSFNGSTVQGSIGSNLRRGKGLACMIKATITPSISCAVVKLNEDASLSIYTGTVEMGQGSETVLAQIAGKELGIPLQTIQVLGVDTDVVPYDLTTSSSRSTFHMGKAVQLAAQDIVRQLKQIVVKEYNVPENKVSFADGRIRLPETQLDYAEVMFKRFGMQGGTLVGEGQVKTSVKDEFGEKTTSAFWFVAAGAAEVEVDLDTGKFKLINYATAVDVGKVLNPLGCRQQLSGAAITGIGQAMFEEIAYDNGQLINPNLIDYVLPSLGDMPSVIDPIAIEIPHKDGPFGAKGIGESALIPVAPAIANAIYDAVGVRIKDLPIKAEKIYLGLQQRKS
ncbi:MAG TPA: xanthine dehydrogenase family protein molybdopterin-binding subunit [Candidatus Binatia bacterium]|jgi:CO/xanthine dehydrogenase Mo-binding subunit|nr:xanthine dehydrogenase family protein molybdopterin-binding subunit [Candidatus Binatia bacterium]